MWSRVPFAALALFVLALLLIESPPLALGVEVQDSPELPAPANDHIECDVDDSHHQGADKGTYMANLWSSHVIPYSYVTGSGVAVNSYTGTDIVFIDGTSPVILCTPADFLPNPILAGDEILVSGSNFNDVSAGNGYVVASIGVDRITLNAGHSLVNEASQNNITIYSTESVTASRQINFENALLDWEAIANVDFVWRTSQTDYVLVKNSNRNRSDVGQEHQGAQDLQLRNWTSNRTIVHELGHTLGVKHEQSRTDRDLFVDIIEENADPDFIGNFNIVWDSNAYPIGEHAIYDFGSIMHYSRTAFSINGQDTIVVYEPWNAQWQALIGTAPEPSKFDRLTMSFLYPPADWRFLYASAPTTTGVGTFHNPYQGFAYAESQVPAGGRLVILYPDVYDAVGVYGEAKLIQAPIGGVVLH